MRPRRVVGIVQARMGSTRCPGKSMAELAGKPLLWHFLQRVGRARQLDEVVLATPLKPEDDVLVELARGCGVAVFRGAEEDLVDRFLQAARAFQAEVIVRLVADNPVIEPGEIDRIVDVHLRSGADFSSNLYNILDNQYPDGIGAEVFGFDRLETVWKEATDAAHREHVHAYFYDHPERFRIGTVPCPIEFRRPELKLDVNTPEELKFLQALYGYCYPRNPQFHITDVIRWYDQVYQPARKAGTGSL